MFTLKDIKARLPRLRQRVVGLAREIHLWNTAQSPLLPLEVHTYVQAIHEAQ